MKFKVLFALVLCVCLPQNSHAQVTLRDLQECDAKLRECEAMCRVLSDLGIPLFRDITYYHCAMTYCKPIHDEFQCRAENPLGDIYGSDK
jgi:hypothetical protein